MEDKWYKIPGYSKYMITKEGKVKSLKFNYPRILKTYKDNHGHVRVDITDDNGKRHTTKLHRLLALTFIPNPYNLPVVRHLNDVSDDNRIENLAWGTQKDNVDDAWRNGSFNNHCKPLLLIKNNEKIQVNTLREASDYLNVPLSTVKSARYSNRLIKGYKIIERSNQMVNVKDELIYELERLKQQKVIKRYDTTFNTFTDKYDIWIKFSDGHASTFNGINSADDFKSELASALPVKKAYKCMLCRNYIPECDGCRRGYYNSLFIPCPDFKSKEFPPTDKEATEALKTIIKDTRLMVGPEAEAHKYADELAVYILEKNGYEKGVKIFDTIDKGYEGIDGDEEYLEYDDILPWQCLLCRKQKTFEAGCIDGLDEGWEKRNDCAFFSHVEFPMQPDEFLFFMDSIREEARGEYAECTDEVVHYNMDKLMTIVLNSLGYSKFAKLYEDMDKHYLSVPF